MNIQYHHLQDWSTSQFNIGVLMPKQLDSQVININDVAWSTCFKQSVRYSNLSSQVFFNCEDQ